MTTVLLNLDYLQKNTLFLSIELQETSLKLGFKKVTRDFLITWLNLSLLLPLVISALCDLRLGFMYCILTLLYACICAYVLQLHLEPNCFLVQKIVKIHLSVVRTTCRNIVEN